MIHVKDRFKFKLFKILYWTSSYFLSILIITFIPMILSAQEKKIVFPGADERTPSKSHYFDWINSQYEGTTEAQTLINMDFFQWLHDEYGMILDVYALDVGNIDVYALDVYALDVGNIDDGPYTAGVGRLIPYHYGAMQSEEFLAQFPDGFAPLEKKRLHSAAVWPSGWVPTDSEIRRRRKKPVPICSLHSVGITISSLLKSMPWPVSSGRKSKKSSCRRSTHVEPSAQTS